MSEEQRQAVRQHLEKPRPDLDTDCCCTGRIKDTPLCACDMAWLEKVNGVYYRIEEVRHSYYIEVTATPVEILKDRVVEIDPKFVEIHADMEFQQNYPFPIKDEDVRWKRLAVDRDYTRKVESVVAHRRKYGLGLKETKDIVENFQKEYKSIKNKRL